MSNLTAAGVALASAAVLAVIDSWITARSGIDEELRARRLEVYPALWQATSIVSHWPRNTVSHESLAELQRNIRQWYYTSGGLFLSHTSKARYGNVQELIAELLKPPESLECGISSDAILADGHYKDLMWTATDLRTALTQDLNTRRRKSLLDWVRRKVSHCRAERNFHRRKARAENEKTRVWTDLATGNAD